MASKEQRKDIPDLQLFNTATFEQFEMGTNSSLLKPILPPSSSLARTNKEKMSFAVLSSAEELMASRLSWTCECMNALMVSYAWRVRRILWIGQWLTQLNAFQ